MRERWPWTWPPTASPGRCSPGRTTHDAITFAHEGLSTPSGDIRLVPELPRLTRLAGQLGLARVLGRQVAPDGSPWPYDQRGVLEAQVEAAAEGLEVRAG